jgi:hypothetical protein
MEYMQRTGKDTPLDALIAAVSSPRALKHLLRQVDLVWRHLHGEVELDDIIIVSAIRHGSGRAYDFLIRDIDAARHKRDAAQDIAPGELRDQTVLRAMNQWKEADGEPLLAGLLTFSEPDDTYSRRWEEFSYRYSEDVLADLTAQLRMRTECTAGPSGRLTPSR